VSASSYSWAALTPTTDINEVLALLRQMLEQQRQDEALEMMATLLAQLRDQNNELQLRLGKLLKQQYGRKSEKLDAAQLSLFMAEAEKALAAMPAPPALPPAPEGENAAREANLPGLKAAPRKGHGRRPLPAALPREEVSHPVPPKERICETCGHEQVCIGHVKSEVLEFIPASFKVLVHVQEKLACKPCGEGVVIGPAADRVIDRGLPGPGLLTQLLLSKYKDSLPLHRLSTIFARSGVKFAVSTLSG
jgi:transposase